ncbi:ATP-dependent RNA helicase HrpA [Nesterenkonia jeotgali]|uniref:ATP-dependent RNA helicase HrpA n=1 Tax=Nesterenkonia jeotgali TaxID=317018 RepID=A0A0W8IGI3_9MICC|nr:ATP-dependent RNA helicase HrpA [Nesterenkonia jeotgali]KUG59029.1 ATP-dependent RNA helicase HrpA [Nesterenkonia jeotgali]
MSEPRTARRETWSAEDLAYPPALPVSGERERILEALAEHQVIVVAGETGSGKTTQLPKMALELGLHNQGMIGHTQPRRLAARTVAERLAEELGTTVGRDIGYQVRFNAEVSGATAVKLMTDGILLAEIQRDPSLRRYSAIIIDEAHERSLNIDVILGYLRRLLPSRPDLKVIVTSATIDPERFARHFSSDPENWSRETSDVPIIEVSGRTYPVEIRYRPVNPEAQLEDFDESEHFGEAEDGGSGPAAPRASQTPASRPGGRSTPGSGAAEEERDLLDAVSDAVLELATEPEGDVLIFFPGEREIRDAAEALTETVSGDRRLRGSEILPLFGRLSMAEQKRVFSPGGRRRIVLATNVAETSLTVPGIKYVIDTGTARISRYSTRTKVQRLPIEAISQASANQRSGRSGRTSDGIAIRLYSQEDFESRPAFTDPEILRTSLASVLLQMSSMGITRSPEELLDFPFVQKPDSKAVNDAVRLLTELGALSLRSGSGGKDQERRKGPGTSSVTPVGRMLSQLPVDPRMARMMVEAARRDCLPEVTVLTAALSIQDPRERPAEKRAQADELHSRFKDENSDFSALLNLWRYLQEKQAELSGNQFRKLCHREHLNYLRVREWQELVAQLTEIADQVEFSGKGSARRRSSSGRRGKKLPGVDPAAKHDAIHQSLLSGLLSHVGLYNPRTRDYQGARGTRFAVFPGSHLFKKNHDWVMASELVETSRLWARSVAKIDPAWVEELAPHLVKTSHSEPRWSARQGAVVATEKVTLFGVPVVADRQVLYSKVDPEYSRELFIQRALVDGDWSTRHHFDRRNRERFAELDELENRTRRKDLRASDEELFNFFDARIPENIVSQRHFDSWWKNQRHETPELLDLTEVELMAQAAEELDIDAYPEHFDHDGLALELQYEFNPTRYTAESGSSRSAAADGVTVRVPVLFLNQLQPERFDWLIPGLRTELITALIRNMPKPIRKNFVPAPDVAAKARDLLEQDFTPGVDSLTESLATVLRRLKGHVLDPEVFDTSALPEHLRFTFAVVSDRGRILESGFDLRELQIRFSRENRDAIGRSLTEDPNTEGAHPGTPQAGGPSARPGKGAGAGKGRGEGSGKGAGKAQHNGRGTVSQPAAEASSAGKQRQRTWSFGELPQEITTVVAGQAITGYPALAPAEKGVSYTIQDSAAEQSRVHRAGVVALLREVLPSPQRYVVDHLSNRERLAFGQSPHGTVESLVSDATTAALAHLVPAQLPYSEAEFQVLARHCRAELIETVLRLTDVLAQILSLSTELGSRLNRVSSTALKAARSDMTAQLEQLVHPGFVTATGQAQLQHLPRYLKAMQARLDRLESGQALTRDAADMASVQELEDEYDAALEAVPAQLPVPADLAAVKWMIEEFRVNLFAQQLGTAQTVSMKRIRRAIKTSRI